MRWLVRVWMKVFDAAVDISWLGSLDNEESWIGHEAREPNGERLEMD